MINAQTMLALPDGIIIDGNGASGTVLLTIFRITLLLGFVWLCAGALRNANPRARILLWRMTALGVIAVAVVSPLPWKLNAPVLPPLHSAVAGENTAGPNGVDVNSLATVPDGAADHSIIRSASDVPPVTSSPAAVAELNDSTALVEQHSGTHESRHQLTRARWTSRSPFVLSVLWGCGVVILLLRWLAGLATTSAIYQKAAAVTPDVAAQAQRVQQSLELRGDVEIRHTDQVLSPYTCGLWQPRILIPTSQCSPDRRRELQASLAHELAHCRGHDLRWHHGLLLLQTVLWFHPLVWRMRSAHFDACDELCDISAAGYVGDPKWYGALLAHLAVLINDQNTKTALAMARPSRARRRATLIGPGRSDIRLTARQFTVTLLSALVVTLACAGLSVIPSHALAPEASARDESELQTTDISRILAELQTEGASLDRVENGSGTVVRFVRPPTQTAVELMEQVPSLEGVGLIGSHVLGENLHFLQKLPNLSTLWLDGDQLTEIGGTIVRDLPRLERLYLMGPGVTDTTLASLQGAPNLKLLTLGNTAVSEDGLRQLVGLPALQSLAILSLDWERRHPDAPRFTDGTIEKVAAIPGLRSLRLHFGTRISDVGLAHVDRLANLEELSLYSDQITDAGLAHIARLKRLKLLWIDAPQTAIGRRPIGRQPSAPPAFTNAGLAHLAELPVLEELTLQNGQFSDDGVAYLVNLKNLRILELSRATISEAGMAQLSRLPSLERFRFPGVDIGEALPQVTKLAKLQSLDLSRSSVTDADLARVRELSSLSSLSLDDSNITDAGLAQIAGATNLRSLSLDRTNVGDEGVRHLRPLKQLTTLKLGGTHVTDESMRIVAQLPALETLWLFNTEISDSGVEHLSGLKQLRSLSLGRTHLTDTGLQYLANLPLLNFLSIGGHQITDEGMRHLTGLTQLSSLTIRDARITDTGMQHLGQIPGLRRLSVDGCSRVTDDGVRHLAGATRLETLSLNGTSVRGTGFADLSLSPLTWISLSRCQIDDVGLEQLGRIVTLTMLYLNDNSITDQGLTQLTGLTNLTTLNLDRTLVTEAGVRQLQQSLPTTSITY